MFRICTPCILKEHLRFAYFTAFLALKCLLAFDFVYSLIELIVNFICLRLSHQNIKQKVETVVWIVTQINRPLRAFQCLLHFRSRSRSFCFVKDVLFPSRRTCQTITITNLLNDPPQTERNMIFYPDIWFFLIENYIKTLAAYRFMDTWLFYPLIPNIICRHLWSLPASPTILVYKLCNNYNCLCLVVI
jgi:hypothetical protein